MIGTALANLGAEIGGLELRGTRAIQGCQIALAVAASVIVAAAIPLQDIWWAAISAYTVSQATRPASIRRGMLRIFGTICGAALGLVLSSTLAYDHVLCALFLLAVGVIGTLGFLLRADGYAWLLGAITAVMVVLTALTDPTAALSAAMNRSAEVIVGTCGAMLSATVFAPATAPAAGPPPPGFTDLLGANRPALIHAFRCGLTVMLIPLVWIQFNVPGLAQMAVTAAAVLAVQPPRGFDDRTPFVTRAVHRLMGCFIGGMFGLLLLLIPLTAFLPWLLILMAGVFVCAEVQAGARGVGYVGTQAAIVYIMTLVQGLGPPTSILPGVERFVGIAGGLIILIVVSFVLGHATDAEPQIQTDAPG